MTSRRQEETIQIVDHVRKVVLASIVKKEHNVYPPLDINLVASKDDMVRLVERMLETKAKFQKQGYSTFVDTGFHYTKTDNMESIRSNGLMSRKDLASNQIKYQAGGGESFGHGIYTANSPTGFQSYGAIGLIVARLKGKLFGFRVRTILSNLLRRLLATNHVVMRLC